MSSNSTNARIDTSDHGLSHPFKGVGAVANGLSGTQMCWRNVSTFSIGAECTRRTFKCPPQLEAKVLRSTSRLAVPLKLFVDMY